MIVQLLKDIRNKVLTPVRKKRKEQEKENKIKAEELKTVAIKKLISGDYYFSHKGHCVCCESEVTFEAHDSWLRDSYFCMNCKCKARERALMTTIEKYYPNWKNLAVHESSPIKRGASLKLRKYSTNYLASQYYPSQEFGSMIDGFKNEDLENQTFADETFDIVITQDVMEHIYNPEKAFKEIGRTLKKGGAHIFTVPIINRHMKTEVWATPGANGEANFLKTPEFHGNPVDPNGSPVTMHWGFDMVDFIKKASGLDTDVVDLYDKNLGIMGEFNEVFVTIKA
jgi:hypothetical protein